MFEKINSHNEWEKLRMPVEKNEMPQSKKIVQSS